VFVAACTPPESPAPSTQHQQLSAAPDVKTASNAQHREPAEHAGRIPALYDQMEPGLRWKEPTSSWQLPLLKPPGLSEAGKL